LRGELGERFARLEAAFDEKLDKKLEAKLTEKLKPFVTKEELEKSLRDQTGLFFGAWGILLAAILPEDLRHLTQQLHTKLRHLPEMAFVRRTDQHTKPELARRGRDSEIV
jgi:hypothetical protein